MLKMSSAKYRLYCTFIEGFIVSVQRFYKGFAQESAGRKRNLADTQSVKSFNSWISFN